MVENTFWVFFKFVFKSKYLKDWGMTNRNITFYIGASCYFDFGRAKSSVYSRLNVARRGGKFEKNRSSKIFSDFGGLFLLLSLM